MSGVRAVDRAIAILQAFTPDQPALTVVQLQKLVGISRPTLYRLLQTLAARGLVRSEGEPQRFMLAHGVMQLCHVWMKGLDVTSIARPILDSLRDRTGETAALFSFSHDRRICLAEAPSRHELAIIRGVGEVTEITRGATGQAILAFMAEDRRRAILNAFFKKSKEDLRAFEGGLERIRAVGYASSSGQLIPGASAIAAPYFDYRGEVAGAVGVYGPETRLPSQLIQPLGELVTRAAQEMSTRLGKPKHADRPEQTGRSSKAPAGRATKRARKPAR